MAHGSVLALCHCTHCLKAYSDLLNFSKIASNVIEKIDNALDLR